MAEARPREEGRELQTPITGARSKVSTPTHFVGFSEEDAEEGILGKFKARLRRVENEGDRARMDLIAFKRQVEEMKNLMLLDRDAEVLLNLKKELEELRSERVSRIRELGDLGKKFDKLREENCDLGKNLSKLKEENKRNTTMIEQLKKENEALKQRYVQGNNETVKEAVKTIMKDEVKTWKDETDKVKLNFRDILKEEQKKQEEKMEKKVVGVLKKNEGLVRDAAEKKKSMVLFGQREVKQSIKGLREKDELKKAKEIIAKLNTESDDKYEDEIEEVFRLGKYVEGGARPLKIRFRSQNTVEELLWRTSKFSKEEELKNLWLRRDLNEEERNRLKELVQTAKEKNEERTEEEKKAFFWRVLDSRLRKWYIRDTKDSK